MLRFLTGTSIHAQTADAWVDNQQVERCATGLAVTALPATGESPLWRALLAKRVAPTLVVLGSVIVLDRLVDHRRLPQG